MTPAGLRLLQDLQLVCTTAKLNCHNRIRHDTPKPAWRQPILQSSHRITNASERSLHQASFTPLLGRHHLQSRSTVQFATTVLPTSNVSS